MTWPGEGEISYLILLRTLILVKRMSYSKNKYYWNLKEDAINLLDFTSWITYTVLSFLFKFCESDVSGSSFFCGVRWGGQLTCLYPLKLIELREYNFAARQTSTFSKCRWNIKEVSWLSAEKGWSVSSLSFTSTWMFL